MRNLFQSNTKIAFFICFLTIAISCGQQKKYVQYTVQKGETMRTIAKDLDMKVRDLLRLNPNVGRRPNPNTLIIVPNSSRVQTLRYNEKLAQQKDSLRIAHEKEVLAEENKKYVLHSVVKGDTFYNLTRLYNVTQKYLNEINPNLALEGLKLGQELRIKLIENDDEVRLYKDTINTNNHIKLGLLLPFRTSYYDTIPTNDIFKKKNKLINIVSDFYLGAQLALDSLQKQGLSVSLNVYDTGKKNTNIKKIVSDYNLNENDVLIGPLYADEAKIVASSLNRPLIFPVYSKSQSSFKSPKIIKTLPDLHSYKEALISHIHQHHIGQNIVVVSDSIERLSGRLFETISQLKLHDSIVNVTVIEPKEGYVEKELLTNALQPDVENWVLLDTEDVVLVDGTFNSLISLPTEADVEKLKEQEEEKEEPQEVTLKPLPEDTVVKVFSYRKGRAYDKIANSKLTTLNFTYGADAFKNDEQQIGSTHFERKFIEKNHTYPSYYAIKGFDITYDVLMRMASGKELKETFKEVSNRLETKFQYDSMIFESSGNKGIYIVQFNKDFTLKRLE